MEKYFIKSHYQGLQFATVACYNADGVMFLAEDYRQLREYTRLLVRCFSLEEDNAESCCGITPTQCRALVETDPANRCCVSITLTDKGKAEFDEIELSMDDYFMRLYLKLPEENRPGVLESLRLLLIAIGTLEE
jgi:hypothetical protein